MLRIGRLLRTCRPRSFTLRVVAAYAASRLVVLSGFYLYAQLLTAGVPGANPPEHVTGLCRLESKRWLSGAAELSLPPPPPGFPAVLAVKASPVSAPLDATFEIVGQQPVQIRLAAGSATYLIALSDSLVTHLVGNVERLVVRVNAPESSPFEITGGRSQDRRNLSLCLEGLAYGGIASYTFDLSDNQYFPQGSHPVESSERRGKLTAFIRGAMMQWDATWYRDIAASGYDFSRDRLQTFQNTPFYPLYPLVCRLTAQITSAPLDLSMILVANLLAVAGIVILAHLARAVLGEDVAQSTVILVCFFPQSLFLSLPYTESCMLLLFSLFLLMLHRRRHLAAAAVCALSTACRPTGLALLPALVLSFLGTHGWQSVRRPALLLKAAGLSLVGLSGLVAYSVYLGIEFGDLLAFSHAQTGWRKMIAHDPMSMLTFSWVLQYIKWSLTQMPLSMLIDPRQMEQWSLVGTLAVLFAARRRLPASWLVSGAIVVLIPYVYFGPTNVGLSSMARYASVDVPLFLALGSFLTGQNRRMSLGATAGVFAAGLLSCSLLFAHGRYFVG